MKTPVVLINLLLLFLSASLTSRIIPGKERVFTQSEKGITLKGFSESPYFEEQILNLEIYNGIKIEINAPAAKIFDRDKKVMLIFYALPNMNNIEETIGRQKSPGLDWHYDIQQIGAQVRFLRNLVTDRNIVIAYLESPEESWQWWRMKHPGEDFIFRKVVDSVANIFRNFSTDIVLDGHSGGGSFVFGYINSVNNIPRKIKRIAFLDSEYDYSDSLNHGEKISRWLKSKPDHFLCSIAYDDRDVIINGKDIGTINGGTFFRSRLMEQRLAKDFHFINEDDSLFIKYTALNGRIKFFLKRNPDHLMWHTLLVEKNGFIESILSGTKYENEGYQLWGWRAYSQYIQP